MFEGWSSPFAQANQQTQDRNNAWAAMKADPASAALIAGLSILANNNGRRSVGQLVGRAGFDALSGLGAMEAQRRAQERQAGLDAERKQYRDMQMQGMQAELDDRDRRRGLEERFAQGDESALRELAPLEWWKAQQAKQQAEQALRNSMTLARYNASLREDNKGQYDPRLGGYVKPDGSFTPIQIPEGFVPPGGSNEFAPVDTAARRELAFLSSLDASIDYMEDALDVAFPKKGKQAGGTGLMVGAMPLKLSSRIDEEGVPLRSAISNFSSQIMNALSGAAVSEQERVRLEGFLPTMYDNEATLRDKVDGYRKYVRSKGKAWQNVYGDHSSFGRMRSFAHSRNEDSSTTVLDFNDIMSW